MAEKNIIKREVTITKDFLQNVCDSQRRREDRYNRLGEIFTEMTGGDFQSIIYDADADKAIDDVLETLLGEKLFEDWSYLTCECAHMDGGGSIHSNGKRYPIASVDALWRFWTREGLI